MTGFIVLFITSIMAIQTITIAAALIGINQNEAKKQQNQRNLNDLDHN